MMKKKTKAEMARELNQFLQLKDVDWERLRKKDLGRLFQAFERLKHDIDEIFKLLDEAPVLSAENPQEIMEKLKSYVI